MGRLFRQGPTGALLDANGGVIERTQYEAFGQTAGSALTRYGYAGRETDNAAGMMYYRARWYDPQQGRFVAEDPIAFEGGTNFYAYVENNPISYSDPLGLRSCKDIVRDIWDTLNELKVGLKNQKRISAGCNGLTRVNLTLIPDLVRLKATKNNSRANRNV